MQKKFRDCAAEDLNIPLISLL